MIEDALDLLMWVGNRHYPHIRNFVHEARKREVCKKIGKLPKGAYAGRTRVFFAHNGGDVEEPVIFGFIVLHRVEVVASNRLHSVNEDVVRRLNIQHFTASDLDHEKERSAGFRSAGSMYLMGQEGSFTLFSPPRLFSAFFDPVARFRGFIKFRRVHGTRILKAKTAQCRTAERWSE